MTDVRRNNVFMELVQEMFGDVAFIFIVQDSDNPEVSQVLSNVKQDKVIVALEGAVAELKGQQNAEDAN